MLLLFVGSGCAALIYEIVWFQLLQLVIGSSAVSLGVLLGTFMGGMCLGSLLLPRCDRRAARIRCASTRASSSASASSALLLLLVHAAHRRRLHRLGRLAASPGIFVRAIAARHLPAAADAADGRDASRDRALGRDDAAKACPGSGSSTAATSPAPWSAACSPASTCLRVHDMAIATFVAVGDQRRRRGHRLCCREERRRTSRPSRQPEGECAVAPGARGPIYVAIGTLRR